MAFSGYNIFPGLTVIGAVSPSVQELAVTFNMEAVNALQMPVEEDLAWSEMAGVTPAVFQGKIPIDFTALDGFEPFHGTRSYKQIDVAALKVDVLQWQRNLEWDIRFNEAGAVEIAGAYNLGNKAASMVAHARVMRARLAASVLMQGTPSTDKARVYEGNDIPGAGKSLFNTAHLANPLFADSRTFSNYHAAAGKFEPATFATTRKNMRTIPSPALSAETLGLQVTDVIGPSIMEEPFRQVSMALLSLQTQVVGGSPVGAATSNIYAAGMTPWRFWIAPQLDADPYLQANPGKHLWFAVSRKLPGARGIEMVAPTKEFTPRIQLFGDGTEMAAATRKVHMIADLDAGAAAGLPHVVARYEET